MYDGNENFVRTIMKKLFLFGLCICVIMAGSCGKVERKDYPVNPVDFTNVKVKDDFWLSRIETNQKVTIPG